MVLTGTAARDFLGVVPGAARRQMEQQAEQGRAEYPDRYRINGRHTLTDQVAERLTTLIVNGDFPAGAMLLPEKHLAEEFAVSRMVIREAVRILGSQGLVGVRHGVGTYVNHPQDWRVAEPLALLLRATEQSLLRWLELRLMLEAGAAPLAAERAAAQDLEALREALTTMRMQASRGLPDAAAFVEADLRFHVGIAAAAQNPLLVCVLRPILAPLEDRLHQALHEPNGPALAVAEHEGILMAIERRDAPAAEAAMRAHLGRVAEEIRRLLECGERSQRGERDGRA